MSGILRADLSVHLGALGAHVKRTGYPRSPAVCDNHLPALMMRGRRGRRICSNRICRITGKVPQYSIAPQRNAVVRRSPIISCRSVVCVHARPFVHLRQHAATSPMIHQMSQLGAGRRTVNCARVGAGRSKAASTTGSSTASVATPITTVPATGTGSQAPAPTDLTRMTADDVPCMNQPCRQRDWF